MTVTLHLDKEIPYLIIDKAIDFMRVGFIEELQLCSVSQGIINLNQYCGADNPEGECKSYRQILKIIEKNIKLF